MTQGGKMAIKQAAAQTNFLLLQEALGGHQLDISSHHCRFLLACHSLCKVGSDIGLFMRAQAAQIFWTLPGAAAIASANANVHWSHLLNDGCMISWCSSAESNVANGVSNTHVITSPEWISGMMPWCLRRSLWSSFSCWSSVWLLGSSLGMQHLQ